MRIKLSLLGLSVSEKEIFSPMAVVVISRNRKHLISPSQLATPLERTTATGHQTPSSIFPS
jgi:hypothetical protein